MPNIGEYSARIFLTTIISTQKNEIFFMNKVNVIIRKEKSKIERLQHIKFNNELKYRQRIDPLLQIYPENILKLFKIYFYKNIYM